MVIYHLVNRDFRLHQHLDLGSRLLSLAEAKKLAKVCLSQQQKLSRQKCFSSTKTFVATKLCLGLRLLSLAAAKKNMQKYASRDKNILARQNVYRDKIMFDRQNLSRDKHIFFSTKDVFCRDKHIFVVTKIILVAAPANNSLSPCEL